MLLPNPSRFAAHWSLSREVVHLNHGSFGACPTEVLNFQQELQRRIEENPMQFYARDYPTLMTEIREVVGQFVGTHADNIALVPNATTGINTVLRSLPWESGDNIVLTNHTYNACTNAIDFVCNRYGATCSVVEIPFPIESESSIVENIIAAVTPQTQLVLLDHITSPTALLLPIEKIIQELNQRGVETLIDGAHAPGMLDLNLDSLKATYYTGNFHKWLCTPKGAAFLYIAPHKQETIRPLNISHGANTGTLSRFRNEFDWLGTHDPTALLAIPKAIEVLSSFFEGGLSEHRLRNAALALKAQMLLADALDIPVPCPPSMLGSMAALPLPRSSSDSGQFDAFREKLFEEAKVEIGFTQPNIAPTRCFRVSAQAYNSLEEYEYLAKYLKNRKITDC